MADKLKESSNDMAPDPATVSSRQGEQLTFARLDLSENGDNADSGDDTPLSELAMGLGKRDRTPSPIKSDQIDVAKPGRRLVSLSCYEGSILFIDDVCRRLFHKNRIHMLLLRLAR